MFHPPRCPNTACARHHEPKPGFCVRRGTYRARCRRRPVQRYRCKACNRSFSRQTFRHDYRDKEPAVNGKLFRLLTSGVGLRQSARTLDVDVRTVQQKLVKMARTCAGLHDNLLLALPSRPTLVMDEDESYEQSTIQRVTIPLVLEATSCFIVAFGTAPIRRLAAPGTARRAWQDRQERLRPRRDQSRACVDEVVRQVAAKSPAGRVTVRTDEKPLYGPILRTHLGRELEHQTTSSRAPRNTRNPLFVVNRAIAMARDNCGRLRKKSWLGSKRRERLHCQLHLFAAYVNFVRPRFNTDAADETPARLLNILPRALTPEELLGWRQDWRRRSIHPLDRCRTPRTRELVAA